MDGSRFDALTRTLRSRRAACNTLIGGAAVLLGLAAPEEAGAHNFVARCRKLSDPAKRRACLRRARAHNRKHQCKPKPPVTFCGTRCGTAINNCKKRVNCPTVCPAGKGCLINGSCAQVCSGPGCPVGCVCNGPEVGFSPLNGGLRCMQNVICEDAQQVCETTADCPLGSFCFHQACPVPGGQQNRCFPLCTG